MEHVSRLQEQARILRTMATSVDMTTIREQLLALAEKCEELAKSFEDGPPERMRTP